MILHVSRFAGLLALAFLAFVFWTTPLQTESQAAFIIAAICVVPGAMGISFCKQAVKGDSRRRPAMSDVAEAVARAGNARWEPVQMVGSRDTSLTGWLFSPAAPNGDAVILLHGLGRSCERMADHAQFLLQQNYTVLTPDSRAHGCSAGDLITYGLDEVYDVNQWADWLCTGRTVTNLYGLGESLGAAVLLQSLPHSSRFRALVVECPFASFHRVAYDWVAAKLRIHTRYARVALWPVIEAGLLYARWRYRLQLQNASPERAIATTDVPVLLIHGTDDRLVPLEHARRLRRSNPGAVTLWEVNGAGHTGALSLCPDLFSHRVLQWFTAHAQLSPELAESDRIAA